MKNFEGKELEEYFNKVETVPYQNDSKLTVNVDASAMANEKYMKNVNDLNITFKGKIDRTKKLSEQDISINYSDDVALPISYRQNDNLYGASSSLIINTYVSVRNENLQGLYDKVGGNTTNSSQENIPNEINTEILEMMPNYIKGEIEKLKKIIQDNMAGANFSKVDENSFAVTLDQKQTMEIATKVLEEVKTSKVLPEGIRNSVAELLTAARNAKVTDAEFLKIIVRKDGNLTISAKDIFTLDIKITANEIVISTNKDDGSVIVKINKIGSGEQVEYDVDYTFMAEETQTMYLKAKYSNISQETASEKYTFGMEETDGEDGIAYEYNFETEKVFRPGMNIEPITANNSFVLNDANKEYLTGTLGPAIMERILYVNKDQMGKLGLEEYQNPLIYATPFGYILYQNRPVEDLMDNGQNNNQENSSQEQNNQTSETTLNEQ